MIAEIRTKSEYGRVDARDGEIFTSTEDQKLQAETQDSLIYAHSVEDAMTWLSTFPIFKDAEIQKREGKIVITYAWMTITDYFGDYGKTTHERYVTTVTPFNTIYESSPAGSLPKTRYDLTPRQDN